MFMFSSDHLLPVRPKEHSVYRHQVESRLDEVTELDYCCTKQGLTTIPTRIIDAPHVISYLT